MTQTFRGKAVKALAPVIAEPGRPLYELTKESILAAIESGIFTPGQQMPSTKDMADQLGVSLVTAHRALQELVSNGVLQRSQGKGTFVHDKYLDRLHSMPKHRLGLVLHSEASIADYYHGQVLDGIRSEADALRFDLVLLRFGEDLRNECDGFLFVNPLPAEVKALVESPVPIRKCVVVGASLNFDPTKIASVDVDNVGLGKRAMEHLAALRHRRVLFIGDDQLSNSLDRFTGFKQAIKQEQITLPPEWVFICSGWRLSETERVRLVRILQSPDRPTAIFAAGYYFALDCYAAARDAGLCVPGDLSVIGVDDPPSARYLSPALTTMSQPLIEVGRTAARYLVNAVNTQDSSPASAIPLIASQLIVRESTATVKHA